MKYKEELQFWLEQYDEESFNKWLQSQPLLEQTDILRELKKLVEENLIERGEFEKFSDLFENYDATIDNYEDKILDEKLAKAQLEMAIEERDKHMEIMALRVDEIREYIKECIETNAPNASEMKNLAQYAIKFQKDAGLFNAENWAFLYSD
jgi:hypothetical protein